LRHRLIPHLQPTRWRLAAWVVLAVVVLAVRATGQATPQAAPAPAGSVAAAPTGTAPAAPAPSSSPAGDASSPATPPGGPAAGLQPPDGKWLKDEKGRLYYLEKQPKIEGKYLRLPDHKVRTQSGIPIEVVREDDRYFYFKVYKVDPAAQFTGINTPSKPSQKTLAAIAASYKVEVAESHRLDFVNFGKGLPRSGQWREGFVLADMNGDGHLDIVHGPPRKSMGPPVIFLGDGKGGWRRWREARFAHFPYDYGDVAVADLDGDGHLDLVLAMHLKGFTALLGDGQGNFLKRWDKGLDFHQAGKRGDTSGGYSSKAIAIVNWNRDSRPDILALGEGPKLALTAKAIASPVGPSQSYGPVVYLNQGDGTWKRRDQGTGDAEVFGQSLTVGDFNGDGRPDFAVGTSVQGRRDLVYLGRADGGWDKVELDVRPGAYVRAVLAADFDKDGRSDLAVGYQSYEGGAWRSGIDLFYSRPGGKWERRALAVKDGLEGVTALGVGDLDGDGNLDLVALTGTGDTWIFLGDGKGFFTRETAGIPAFGPGCVGNRVRLADLDGDGKAEIVASWSGEYEAIYAPSACRSEGGITAWHAVPAPGAKAAAAAAAAGSPKKSAGSP
jgi:FG-GAP-like repeat